MTALVDTSALYALLDEDDDHGAPVTTWTRLLGAERLVTHAYVVVESSALVQRRLGTAAAGRLHRALLPAVAVSAVGQRTHDRAVERWLGAGRRRGPGLRRAAAARSVRCMDPADLLALRTDQRAALLLLGLRGDW